MPICNPFRAFQTGEHGVRWPDEHPEPIQMEVAMRTITLVLFSVAIVLMACSPEPGSKAWCASMDEKSAGDWTANEAGEYAKSCVFTTDD